MKISIETAVLREADAGADAWEVARDPYGEVGRHVCCWSRSWATLKIMRFDGQSWSCSQLSLTYLMWMMQLLNARASMGETAGFWSIAEAPVLFLFIKCWSSWNSRASTQLRLRGNIGMIVQRGSCPIFVQPEVISSPPAGTSWPKKDSKRSHHWGHAQVSSESQGAAGAPRAGKFPKTSQQACSMDIPCFFPVIFPMIINDFPLFSTSFHSLSNSSVFVDDYFYGPWMIFSFFFYDFEHDIPSMFHSLSWKNPLLFHDIWPRSAEDLYSAVAGKKDVVEKTLGKRSC